MQKTKIFYISPSVIPSRSANSIHVMNMCEALSKQCDEVDLFIKLTSDNTKIEHFYGIDIKNIYMHSPYFSATKAIELRIAIKSLVIYVKNIFYKNIEVKIISRNLYAAFIFGSILNKNIVYETHSPEKGFRKLLQKIILNSAKINTVVISEALKKILLKHHSLKNSCLPIIVLHDAAKSGQQKISSCEKIAKRKELLINLVPKFNDYQMICGYFGHLYPGRGIEVILDTAKKNKKNLFMIFGGNESQINYYKKNNNISNIIFGGFLRPSFVKDYMKIMDILLMPYQKSVSIGIKNSNTVEWMSPMKLFEYMSTGVPIVSSDLPVLREVLLSKKNCLLVDASNSDDWNNAIELLTKDINLYDHISYNSYKEYENFYTWDKRVEKILENI